MCRTDYYHGQPFPSSIYGACYSGHAPAFLASANAVSRSYQATEKNKKEAKAAKLG
jgi:hypothetical protein